MSKKGAVEKVDFSGLDLTQEELDRLIATVVVKEWPYQYVPVEPTPLQLAFCILPNRVAMMGGAAGGGKSEGLLMAALQYVNVPGYSAIIYRRSYADLARQGALLTRALEWLSPHFGRGVHYDPTTKRFTFPSGATLSFGYMGVKGADSAVQGSEVHFVGVDEVTQHFKEDVAWAESRLRRTKGSVIPLRTRFTGNPGGKGHEWVKQRFGIKKNPKWDPEVGTVVGGHLFSDQPMFVGTNKEEVFIPARVIDNPYLDVKEYVRQFKWLDEITRNQLLDGDWDSAPKSRFRRNWFPRYTMRGSWYQVGDLEVQASSMRKFCTVDVAASVREGVAGEQFYTFGGGRSAPIPCWTVVSTWGLAAGKLWLLDVERGQVESPEVFDMIRRACNKWRCQEAWVEANGVGRPVAQVARREGLPVQEIWTVYDKLQNSYTAANFARAGLVVLPDPSLNYGWLQAFEDEVFTWTGNRDDTSDQVDTLSTAAKVAEDDLRLESQGQAEVGGLEGAQSALPGMRGEDGAWRLVSEGGLGRDPAPHLRPVWQQEYVGPWG